jgi:RNA polymerase sigma-70 factor (ECF subfamily)
MSTQGTFVDLIRRVRAGDERAATELVRQYEPTIRRAVRFRLVDARLGTLLDSMDVCQSVLASFFVRAAAGAYELDRPEDLLKLLVTMARNKLASQARRQQADCRDVRRRAAGGLDAGQVAAGDASPSQAVAAAELLREVQCRLTAEERQLVAWRQEGRDWADIAAELGANPVALRKKLSRALDRVTRELGLDE